MSTNYYLLNTYNLDSPENGWGNSHIWLAAGDGVPLTLHRVDVSFDANASATYLKDPFHLDIGRLPSMDGVNEVVAEDPDDAILQGPLTGADIRGQDGNSVFKPLAASAPLASCSVYWASGFTRAFQGPWMWTSDPDHSHHTLDLSEFGGFNVDGNSVLHVAFSHDWANYGQSFRLGLFLSEETS